MDTRVVIVERLPVLLDGLLECKTYSTNEDQLKIPLGRVLCPASSRAASMLFVALSSPLRGSYYRPFDGARCKDPYRGSESGRFLVREY